MKKKKAQQLVEFLLVTPFIIVFLGILTEYAYALNINLTLNNALKTITTSIYSEIKPSMSINDINDTINNRLVIYLSENNIPVESENNITVTTVTMGSTVVFMANYTYYSAFTLPNIFFTFIPEKFNFLATSAVPSAFLKENNYDSISSITLDKIWSSSISFVAQDGFNAAKKGIYKTTSGRDKILFFIPADIVGLNNCYILAKWSGLILNSGNVLAISTKNGNNPNVQVCNLSDFTCSDSGQKIYSYIKSNSYTNLYFVNQKLLYSLLNISSISSSWLDSNDEDISNSEITGLLKNTISLTDEDGLYFGNYDNIEVNNYNEDISSGNSFMMKAFGSMIFMNDTSNTLNSIITSDFTAERLNKEWSE